MHFFTGNFYLSLGEMQENARYIHAYLTERGWSLNAIAGLLGNMQSESTINPGIYENLDSSSLVNGFGLVQWTPNSHYKDWVLTTFRTSDYGNMKYNLERIIYEKNNGIQYYATQDYPYNFNEFATSNKSPYELACAFAWNYERSYVVLYGTDAQKEALRRERGGQADYWFEFLGGVTPPTTTKKRKFKFLLFSKQLKKLTKRI